MTDSDQLQLEKVYREWKGATVFGDVDGFGPPLLLKITDDYRRSNVRIVVYGQETFGWSWNAEELQRFEYPSPEWRFSDQCKFEDFRHNADSVDALVHGYERFSFARYQPLNWRSPFWTAFREVQRIPESAAMWSNLVRADYQCGSVRFAPQTQLDSFLAAQAELLHKELDILRPHASIFFVGPTYDPILEGAFPAIEFKPVEHRSVRTLAQLGHRDLPPRSYRTYHLGYLRRSGQWQLVADVCSLIRDEHISTR